VAAGIGWGSLQHSHRSPAGICGDGRWGGRGRVGKGQEERGGRVGEGNVKGKSVKGKKKRGEWEGGKERAGRGEIAPYSVL